MPFNSRMSQVMNKQLARESGLAPVQGSFTGLMPVGMGAESEISSIPYGNHNTI